jgi:hypothetical protein
MSGQPQTSRRKGARALTWTCLTLIPALAIVALGTGLLPTLADTSVPAPSGLLVAETRAFNTQGDDVSGLVANQADDRDSVDQFMDHWQNTVRRRPSPRR